MPLLSPKTLPPPLLRLLSLSLSPTRRFSAEASSQKLDRIADELLALTTAERRDYSLLFRRKLGLSGWVPAGGAAGFAGLASPLLEAEGGVQAAEAKEKTAFDVKLEKFEAAAKIKIIKEVRTFTDLGLKEAKELVEKAPVVLKMGLPKEEAEKILAKLKDVGATVVLE